MTTSQPVTAVWAETTANSHSPRPGSFIMGSTLSPGLPWPNNKAELNHFRQTTRDAILVMGMHTFRSLPPHMKRRASLEERPMVVFTTRERYAAASYDLAQAIDPGVCVQPIPIDVPGFSMPERVVAAAREWFGNKPIAVIGGPKVIEFMVPALSSMVVTDMRQRVFGDVLAPNSSVFNGFDQVGTYEQYPGQNFRVYSYIRAAK